VAEFSTTTGAAAHIPTVIEHSSRHIHVLGAAVHPTAEEAMQVARDALMDLAEHADEFKVLIRDHGAQFTAAFDAEFHAADLRIVTTGIQAR
jgi:hypothetical protein